MLDRVIAFLLLILLSPVLVVIAVLVALRVGSPVIFRQERVGLNGERFRLYKFRTMIPDRRRDKHHFVGRDRRVIHKSENDPRVLPLGRFLRKWSLDELPQLWNIVVGDMSLVGPRPEVPQIVAKYEPWQFQRHVVKPGLTGAWQISNREQMLHECTEIDLNYIEQQSFATDIKILLATPIAMLGRPQGY